MIVNISLPDVGYRNISSRDLIVSILAKKWPLSVRKIYSIAKREYGFNVTYQAIHKTLKLLEEKKVIEKRKKEYQLNLEWIKKLKNFSEELEECYTNNKPNPFETKKIDFLNLNFETIIEVDKFILKSIERFQEIEKQKLFAYWNHLWIPLYFSKEEYAQLKGIGKINEAYILCKGNTALDKWSAKFYKELGMNVLLGVKDFQTTDILVLNDYIIQVFYSKSLVNRVSKNILKIKKIDELNLNKLFQNVFEKKSNIQVTINKNQLLAKQLGNEIKSYFKNKKINTIKK